jgi:nucleotide-binding universal stress UspA family protein
MLTQINTILYASDLDKEMKPALLMAMSLANKYQAKIVFLHVIEPVNPAVYNWGSADMWLEVKENAYQRSLDVATEIIEGLSAEISAAGSTMATPEVKIIHGNPTERILNCSQEVNADMVIMGSHGHDLLGHLLLGSVADKVMRMSSCPVLLVPADKSS